MMELNQDDVQGRLQQLAKKDRKRKVFGTAAHDYQLTPPLDMETVGIYDNDRVIDVPQQRRPAQRTLAHDLGPVLAVLDQNPSWLRFTVIE